MPLLCGFRRICSLQLAIDKTLTQIKTGSYPFRKVCSPFFAFQARYPKKIVLDSGRPLLHRGIGSAARMSISRSSKPGFPAGVLRTREMVPVDSPALIYRMLLHLLFAWFFPHLRALNYVYGGRHPIGLSKPVNSCPDCLKVWRFELCRLAIFEIQDRLPDA